jgi:hypothetical protein
MSTAIAQPSAGAKLSFGTGVIATRLGAIIAPGITYQQWLDALQRALAFEDLTRWAIGDLLAHGEWNYGDKYRAVLERLDIRYDHARDLAYVAGNVPGGQDGVRREDLSWSHHRAVAKLVPVEQERWLARAADDGWSKRDLIDAIAQAEAKPAVRAAVLEQLRFTVDPDRRHRYQDAAERAGLSIQEWATTTLDKAAGA